MDRRTIGGFCVVYRCLGEDMVGIMDKKYTSFVNTSYKRILCDSEGHAIRPMTKKEEEKWDDDFPLFGYVRFSDEELEEGHEEFSDW